MDAQLLDGACVLIFALGGILGWHRGFVVMFGGLVNIVVSILGGLWGTSSAENVLGIPFSSNPLWFVGAFLAIAGICHTIFGFLVSILDLVRRLFTLIPGFGLLHRLAGAVVGLLESVLLVGLVSYGAFTLFPHEALSVSLQASRILQELHVWMGLLLG